MDDFTDEEYKRALDSIPALNQLIKEHQSEYVEKDVYFLKELLLWGLVSYKKLNKQRFSDGFEFKDLYSSFLKDI